LAFLVAFAACAQSRDGAVLPNSGRSSGSDAWNENAPRTAAHAPCTIASGLHSPIKGTPVVATAFGELEQTAGGTRYAFPAVVFTYQKNRAILAALTGTAYSSKHFRGVSGAAIVIRAASGAEVLYSGFASSRLHKRVIAVKAGWPIAYSGGSFQFTYFPNGNFQTSGVAANPCGNSNGASGTIGIMASNVAVQARFHSLALNGVALTPGPYPTSPDVQTPSFLSAENVTAAQTVSATVYERSAAFSTYYVVLCGNVAFATGPHLRYAGPFTDPNASSSPRPLVTPSPLPKLVFFRDPGSFGSSLTEQLPAPWSNACPAPAPAFTYGYPTIVFNEIGQTEWAYFWWLSPSSSPSPAPTAPSNATVTLLSTSAAVATASPGVVSMYPTQPPAWPPPPNHATIVAAGIGTATVYGSPSPNCNCQSPAPIGVTVNAPPTPAPVPTPVPNMTPTPTASPSNSPSPSPSPT
jgi:hypothetical protein